MFDRSGPVYTELAAILAVRKAEPALRRGRQYLREISGDGRSFGHPSSVDGGRIRGVVAWSRILGDRELVCAINTDPVDPRAAWVTVDAGLHAAGAKLSCLHRSGGATAPVPVEERNGRAICVELPPGGFAIYG